MYRRNCFGLDGKHRYKNTVTTVFALNWRQPIGLIKSQQYYSSWSYICTWTWYGCFRLWEALSILPNVTSKQLSDSSADLLVLVTCDMNSGNGIWTSSGLDAEYAKDWCKVVWQLWFTELIVNRKSDTSYILFSIFDTFPQLSDFQFELKSYCSNITVVTCFYIRLSADLVNFKPSPYWSRLPTRMNFDCSQKLKSTINDLPYFHFLSINFSNSSIAQRCIRILPKFSFSFLSTIFLFQSCFHRKTLSALKSYWGNNVSELFEN